MPSLMRLEADEAPAAAARVLQAQAPRLAALAAQLQQDPPAAVLTLARGSSDHAAQYLAYLAMVRLARLVTSLPPSLLTLYHAPLPARGLLALALSQSGQSPDLVEPLRQLTAQGALGVALVNDAASPLAQAATQVLALHAGAERSVAATKSCICQFVAGAALVAAWQGDAAFNAALQALPQQLQQAQALDWNAAIPVLQPAQHLFVVSRGPALAVAHEAALKLQEVCGLQAQAYSGAELQHGPMALVDAGFPVLLIAPRGPAQSGLLALAQQLRQRGAQVLLAAPAGVEHALLPLLATDHEHLDPIAALPPLYRLAEALAWARGLDPDRPRHLRKVTKTR